MMARACGKTRVVPQNGQPRPESTATGVAKCVCPPAECAEGVAEVGVPLVPAGPPVRPLVHGATPSSAADLPRWRGRPA